MQDIVYEEIKKKMFEWGTDWEYNKETDLYLHPTRIFGYGSLSEDLRKRLSEINLEELFLDKPKPDWIFYAFRKGDLLKLNSFLTFIKSFFLKSGSMLPYPLVLQIDNGNYIIIAPMQYQGDLSQFKGTPAWNLSDSFLFDFVDDIDELDDDIMVKMEDLDSDVMEEK